MKIALKLNVLLAKNHWRLTFCLPLYNLRYVKICLELSESLCTSYQNSKSHIITIFLFHVKNRHIFVTLGQYAIVTIGRDHV